LTRRRGNNALQRHIVPFEYDGELFHVVLQHGPLTHLKKNLGAVEKRSRLLQVFLNFNQQLGK
jgi:hypothetical protein